MSEPTQYILIRATNGWIIEVVGQENSTEGYVVCGNLASALNAVKETEEDGGDLDVEFEEN